VITFNVCSNCNVALLYYFSLNDVLLLCDIDSVSIIGTGPPKCDPGPGDLPGPGRSCVTQICSYPTSR